MDSKGVRQGFEWDLKRMSDLTECRGSFSAVSNPIQTSFKAVAKQLQSSCEAVSKHGVEGMTEIWMGFEIALKLIGNGFEWGLKGFDICIWNGFERGLQGIERL